MKEPKLNKYDSSIYLADFDTKELEIVHSSEPELHFYQNGVLLRRGDIKATFTKDQYDQFKREGITLSRREAVEAHAVCEVGPEDRRFAVWLKTIDDCVVPELVDVARDALSQIVELDDESRKISNMAADKPLLSELKVYPNKIGFSYVSMTVNSDWIIGFKKAENGEWEFTEIYN